MNPSARPLVLFALLVAAAPAPAADKTPAFAGWYDLLPPSGHLVPHSDHPVVPKPKGGEQRYSQAAHFDAFTGLPRAFTVTLARDPAFKTQHSKDTLKKAATPLEIGSRTAWVWKGDRKVIVPLGDDTAIIVETDQGSQPMPVVEYAKSLDYDRMEKALAAPPRTDFAPTLATFEVFKKGGSVRGLYEWAGPAKACEPVGAKGDERFRWVYALKDGSKVIVTAAGAKIESATHETADGKSIELLK